MPELFEPKTLNYYTLSRLILWILCVSSNPTLTHLNLSGSLDPLLCNLIALTPDLAFFSPAGLHASGGVIISVNQSLSFSELFIPLSLLDPYSDYVGSTSH